MKRTPRWGDCCSQKKSKYVCGMVFFVTRTFIKSVFGTKKNEKKYKVVELILGCVSTNFQPKFSKNQKKKSKKMSGSYFLVFASFVPLLRIKDDQCKLAASSAEIGKMRGRKKLPSTTKKY